MLGGVEDGPGDGLGRVGGRREGRLVVHVVGRVLRVRRVDGAGLDERHADGHARLLELHPQRVREALDGVLARAVVPLQRDRAV